jgi:eukaryotic-like serine/threonine-protein kinase
MEPEQWNQVVELFHAAREKTGEERIALLESACAGNAALRESVEQLLRDDEAPDNFLNDSPVQALTATELRIRPSVRPKVGRYELVAPLGRGGAGEVWKAHDTELGRSVALKFLVTAPGFAPASERLTREARAASALNHPYIVTVHEILHDDQTPVLVMELVEGTTLRALSATPQPLDRVIAAGRQVAQALGAAHAHGIVHRDVKPENVIVRNDGYVKVLDFGLARHISSESAASTTGLLAGTLRYMSPEQARGESLSPATDVFSFGLVLYEFVAGRHPFPAESPFETVHAIQASEAPPPSSLNPRVPAALDSLTLAMLAKDPGARPSAGEVDRRLAEIQTAIKPDDHSRLAPFWGRGAGSEGVPVAEERSRRLRKARSLRYLAAAVAVGLACALVLWLLWGKIFPPREPEMTQLTTQESENRVTSADISPDGKTLAFSELGGPIDLRRMSDGFTRPLNTPAGLTVDRIVWFADGSRLLVSGSVSDHPSAIWVTPIGAGAPKLVISGGKDAVPSPDGTRIALTNLDGSEIWEIGIRGEAPREVRVGGSTTSFSALIWSPDSKRVEYQRRDYTPRANQNGDQPEKNYTYSFESVDVETGQLVALAKNVVMTSACGLPDGRVLALRWTSPEITFMHQIWELRTDPHTGRLRGRPRQLTHATNLNLSSISASNDGKQVVAVITTHLSNIYVADLSPASQLPRLLNIRRLTFAEADDFPHAWTRDGRSVIFESNRNGEYDLYRQSIDQREPEPLVESPGDDVLERLSPDGKWVLYRWDEDGDRRLMRVGVDGGTPAPVRIDGKLDEFRCPLDAGAECVLRSVEDGEFVFHALDPVRGEGAELARTAWRPTIVGDWDVSPDGSQVAIPNHDPDSAKIRLVALRSRVPGMAEKTVTVNGLANLCGLNWSADGRGWYVTILSNAKELFAGRLFYVDLEGHWTDVSGSAAPGWLVPSPDGRHGAFPQDMAWSNAWLFHGF